MSWEYAKDHRTDEEVKKDFDFGKQKEREAIFKLPFLIIPVNKDEFGRVLDYGPDWFLYKEQFWYPTEVKYSHSNLTHVDCKKNQIDWLAEYGGLYIQTTDNKFMIKLASKIIAECDIVTDTYCSKPCYRVEKPEWHNW